MQGRVPNRNARALFRDAAVPQKSSRKRGGAREQLLYAEGGSEGLGTRVWSREGRTLRRLARTPLALTVARQCALCSSAACDLVSVSLRECSTAALRDSYPL